MTAELATVDPAARPAMLTPATFKEGWGLAKSIAGTTFVPKGLRGDVNAVFACLLWGMEAGIGPIQSLNGVHVIEGHAAPKPELMRALVLRAGHTLDMRELSDESCTIYGARKEGNAAVEVTWTMTQAKAAGLAGKDVWRKYPRAMLLARATSEVCRAIFSDVIAGLGYTPDERAEIERVEWDPDEDQHEIPAVIGPVPDGDAGEAPGAAPAAAPGDTNEIIDAEVVEDSTLPEESSEASAPPPGVDPETGEVTALPRDVLEDLVKAMKGQRKVAWIRWLNTEHDPAWPSLVEKLSDAQVSEALAHLGGKS